MLNSQKTFFSWLININNLALFNFSDLMKSSNFSLEDLSNPKSFVHKPISSFNCYKRFALSEEQSQCSRNITTWIRLWVPYVGLSFIMMSVSGLSSFLSSCLTRVYLALVAIGDIIKDFNYQKWKGIIKYWNNYLKIFFGSLQFVSNQKGY